MKVIFFGTSEFAIPSLRKLVASKHEVLAVVTQPDRKKGRHLKLSQPPIKIEALKHGIKDIYQPPDPSIGKFIENIAAYKADLFCVIAYGHILCNKVLTLPDKSCINMHGSLLPKYRGASPMHWAIVNGEKATGLSIIRMNQTMDAGDIIAQSPQIPIKATDTYLSLSEKLAQAGADLLLETIDSIEKGRATFTPQDESKTTYAPKLKKQDGLIDWKMSARQIHNRVRAFIPWPIAHTFLKGKLLRVWEARISAIKAEGKKPGEVVSKKDNKLQIATGSEVLEINRLQPANSKQMDIAAFLAGHDLKTGDTLGN